MKKFIHLLGAATLLSAGLVSCNQPHDNGMDNATMTRRVDSATAAQWQMEQENINRACQDNFSMNVKAKGDSIVMARTGSTKNPNM